MRATLLVWMLLAPGLALAQQATPPTAFGPRGTAIPPPDIAGTPRPAGPVAAPAPAPPRR
ncbi:MAG: hypothetical protein ACK5PI_01205 [Acetobacteraceae bacterium]